MWYMVVFGIGESQSAGGEGRAEPELVGTRGV